MWFAGHFLLVFAVCSVEILSLIANGFTSLPAATEEYARKGEETVSTGLVEKLPLRHPMRECLATYQHSAGIDLGYGFFAPSVPNSYKLVFEISYPNGDIEYDLPRVYDKEAGARLTSLFEQVGRIQYDPLREMTLKMLAYSSWQDHPDATEIRAVFGFVRIPTPAEMRRGEKETYRFMHAYDFRLPASQHETVSDK